MARIRSIKPEFWTSEQIIECSPMARLLFIGMWNFCDDAGNHTASAKTLKAEIFPSDDITSTNVQLLLDELVANELIVLYTAENKDFYHVTGWKKHQKIDRPTVKHPPFDEKSIATRRTFDERLPPERNGEEGNRNGEEGNRNGEEGSGEEVGEVSETITRETSNPPPPPVDYEKFSMHPDWVPSNQLETLCKMSGVSITPNTSNSSLKEFRTYWYTRQNIQRSQNEWDHAFVKSLKSTQERQSGRSPPDRRTRAEIAANSLHDPIQDEQSGGEYAQLT
ncbi:hypothetical protein SAMN05192560_0766 [Methylobacillus rhizosphaerae]|uniref:DnaT DNA-binding domain-containing protein n=1 Tax=Methylobacillus rhizosphaerae TaxID=551994 RepID=A0A238YR17_9PROT|nr:DnaT-like ssDNA-binding domain-containing protein [Methylobacillus rhizosphaerae]SNR73587.1 hypothetical protein SAMN05192560_0766 [Methylobacillus rhizosphaerae]